MLAFDQPLQNCMTCFNFAFFYLYNLEKNTNITIPI